LTTQSYTHSGSSYSDSWKLPFNTAPPRAPCSHSSLPATLLPRAEVTAHRRLAGTRTTEASERLCVCVGNVNVILIINFDKSEYHNNVLF